MATRMRIAAVACVVMSGLIVAGAGAAMAFADPEAGHSGETGGSHPDPTGGPNPAPTADQKPTTEKTSASAEDATPTVTAPRPTADVGDGRNGQTAAASRTSRTAPSSSKGARTEAAHPSQTDSTDTGEPTVSASAPAASTSQSTPETTGETTSTTTTTGPPPPAHLGWHWPWWWPDAPSGGGGSGGNVSVGEPIGIPKPPPMQLPTATIAEVMPSALPVPPVGAITGLATAAAELPFMALTLPAIAPPDGAGGGGGAAIGNGSAPPPVNSGQLPSPGRERAGRSPIPSQPNPPAYGASNRVLPASYRAGYGEYLRSAGVGQMAAVAVPGVGGILVLTGAGGLVGYRQARAGHSVRTNGTGRFVG